MLWQHLFWFFGHPEVYIIALPFFGVVTEVIPVFSRKPLFGYRGFVFATLAIAALSTGVWAHHMFATGAVNLPFFSGMTFLIAVPTGVKMFNWIGTMWRGHLRFDTPMLFCVGFLVVFLIGGLTGPMIASTAVRPAVTDTYFIVAHMHYVLFGTAAFGFFAGLYFWYPKFTGRLLDERLGKLSFWLMFVGFNLTFWVQHLLGPAGDAPPGVRLRPRHRVGDAQPPVERRLGHPRPVDDGAAGQPVADLEARGSIRRRPVGRVLVGVGHVVAPAGAQLPLPAPHPLGAAGVRRPPAGSGDEAAAG